MRKMFLSFVLMLSLLAFVVPGFSQGGTVVDAAVSISDFSTLVAAAQAAGLVDTLASPGPFTVFAPTNGAFQTLLNELGVSAEQLLADRALVRSVLLYHVVPGKVMAADIIGGQLPLTVGTANGATVNINVVAGKVSLNNGRAIVTTPDIVVSNGVIHVIDNVILPPSAAAASAPAAAPRVALPTVVGAASSISDFSTLVAAAQAAGLVDTLNSGGPFTVFAPTNGAFQTLLNELGVTAEQLLADRALVRSVLLYHVVPGKVMAADIIGGELPLNARTANGATVNINVVAGKVSLNNGRAIVTTPDIEVSNGVIHVIDNVILPPQ